MLKVTDVGKTYGKFTALQDINLEVKDGEFLAIMGPSGSGKSTLINILGLLDQSYTGEYLLENKNYQTVNDNELSQIRGDQLGFVFQNFKLLSTYTVYENIEVPLIYSKKAQNNKHQLIESVIEKVGLKGKEKNLPTELSGGQQQRVAIARAIVNRPKLVIADEPTGALDSKTSKEIMDIFEKLNQDGTTIIMVTHDSEVAEHAMRTVYIRDGRLYNDEKSVKNHD
ncbi:ABC transporter ATP-binding protein [Companilactobacillus pabuli]|uniref:ABC transporter ATP-binding protein n=1 Tax=Companilactobacillus pabuli TaxID=2714036 RepID=A0A7L7L0A2_9LACO|nr:ABC transporter ATP-binding protein [Companilactobacillus pabuli]AKP04261.1 peptide ABC transporter ATP-binding protein [Companilactobacillus farciminis]AKS52568.1 peptide ABC transporter ATP-binding protein [Companilactobacillus farciminis]MDG5112020.1 ABC transporter ATP-binding protein [Companilactobacillus pabuli]QMT85400.1 ABC transporter ATP-binding protein [Companilactobacillus pabuli]GAQ00826.1 peptide ABC transporter ATP-binding protein [Companilactobacillus farciminis]